MSRDARSGSSGRDRPHPDRDLDHHRGYDHDYDGHHESYDCSYDDQNRRGSGPGYRPPRDGYRDDHRFRQAGRRDYSRSPPRSELPYDDIPDDRDSARYARGQGYEGAEYESRDARRDYRGRGNFDQGRYRDRRGHSRPRREDDGFYDDYPERAESSRYSPGEYPQRRRSPSPARNAGPPSDTIILEGLPPNIQSDELRDCLQYHPDMSRYPSLDVRVPGGRGRRAFVQFQHIDDAVDFVQANYPKLLLDFGGIVDGDPEGKTAVYIHFARNREEPEPRGGQGQNWACPICDFSNFSTRIRCKNCGSPQTDVSLYRQYNLTGESDAAEGNPSQILVFYPLAPSVTEEVLASGAAKLELVEKPSAPKNSGEGPKLKSTAPVGDTSGYGARPGSLHRVFLMRDQQTNQSFKFGFAEFWTVEDALAAITKFKKFREFTVASATVNVSTIHLGVFVPETRELTSATETLSFHPLFNPTIRVTYWDPSVYPSRKRVTEAPPEGTKSQKTEDDANGDGKKSKKRKAEGSLPSSAVKKAAPMSGQMAVWQKKHDELHEGKVKAGDEEKEASGPVKISLSSANSQGPIKISLSGSGSKSISPGTGPSSASPHGKSPNTLAAPAPQPPADEMPLPPPVTPAPVSYADREKVCCLLCMMKYKSLDDLNTHEKSRNHKTALEDEDKVKKAKERLVKRFGSSSGKSGDGTQAEDAGPQYRDRAKERREVFNQPKKPSPNQAGGGRRDQKSSSQSTGDSNPPEPQAQPKPQSKGSAMLAKMGWTSGQGLGAQGDGRTQVVETNAYQEGVGLGAEGGKLGDAAEVAQRRTTNSYAEYLSSAQDKARERYNRMA